MDITATLKYLRISPRKVRLVAGLLKGAPVQGARAQLRFSNKRAAEPLLKLLNSAAANAKRNFSKDSEGLYIKHIYVDQGPVYKRFRPRARGVASPIARMTSHIKIVLDEIKHES